MIVSLKTLHPPWAGRTTSTLTTTVPSGNLTPKTKTKAHTNICTHTFIVALSLTATTGNYTSSFLQINGWKTSCPYNGIVLSSKKESTTGTLNSVDKFHRHYAKWKKKSNFKGLWIISCLIPFTCWSLKDYKDRKAAISYQRSYVGEIVKDSKRHMFNSDYGGDHRKMQLLKFTVLSCFEWQDW